MYNACAIQRAVRSARGPAHSQYLGLIFAAKGFRQGLSVSYDLIPFTNEFKKHQKQWRISASMMFKPGSKFLLFEDASWLELYSLGTMSKDALVFVYCKA